MDRFQVRELVGQCSCPVQFPMIKVGEGKYQIGDSRTLIFVRVSATGIQVCMCVCVCWGGGLRQVPDW